MKAKIIVPVILILLCCCQLSSAQVLVGPVAGGNFSWINFNDKDLKDEYKVKPVFGFHAGAQVSFRVRKRFFLHTSVIYSTKGKVLEGKTQALDLKQINRYIEMPIVYTVNFKGNIGKKPFKYFVGVGPNISYWLGGGGTVENTDTHEFSTTGPVVEYKVKFGPPPENLSEMKDETMYVARPNRVQLGINITTGLVFEPAPFREIMVTLRYERGHSFMSRESNGLFKVTYYEDIMQIRNQGLRLSVAYLIDLRVDQRKKGKSSFDKKKF